MNDVIKSYEHFASVNDFADALANRPLTPSGKKYASYANAFLDAVLFFLRHGDAETAAKIKVMQKSLKMQGNGNKKAVEVCKSFCGFMPNVGAMMAGDPNCMINVRNNIRRDSKVVDIAISFTSWRGIDEQKEFFAKSVFLSALARLESQGYMFNLDAIGGGKSVKMEHLTLYSISLKKATQRLNITNIAFLVANKNSFLASILYKAKCNKFECYKCKHISCTGYIPTLDNINDLYPNKKAKIITLKDIYGKTEDEIIEVLTK